MFYSADITPSVASHPRVQLTPLCGLHQTAYLSWQTFHRDSSSVSSRQVHGKLSPFHGQITVFAPTLKLLLEENRKCCHRSGADLLTLGSQQPLPTHKQHWAKWGCATGWGSSVCLSNMCLFVDVYAQFWGLSEKCEHYLQTNGLLGYFTNVWFGWESYECVNCLGVFLSSPHPLMCIYDTTDMLPASIYRLHTDIARPVSNQYWGIMEISNYIKIYITLNFRCECPSYSTLSDNSCVVFLTTSVTILKDFKIGQTILQFTNNEVVKILCTRVHAFNHSRSWS